MNRYLYLCVLLLTTPCAGWSNDQSAATETVFRLKVQAARAPKPAQKYQLLPELRTVNPGNPIQGYLKCFAEQNPFFFGKQSIEEREKWLDMPLKDLPVQKLRGYGGLALRQADEAARLDNPDWQVLLQLKSAGIELLVPDLQQMRVLAAALRVRLRGEIADRRFDDALITMQTMLALSRHTAEHPTLIAFLVSAAIANITLEPFEDMVMQPGCPNLFWALSDLPHPLVDLRRALQGERIFMMKEFADVDDKAPMTVAQVQNVVDRFQRMQHLMTLNPDGQKLKPELRDWFADRTKDQAYVAAARKRLTEYGMADDVVKKFPALQVVFLDEKHHFLERRDDAFKGMLLPFWQMEPLLAGRTLAHDSPLVRMVPTSAGVKVRQAQARLDQRIAMLRCIEALRLHAADHDGKLPTQLTEIKLPLPVDQFSGKAFHYKLDGNTAILHGTPPAGFEKSPSYNIRYEVTIAR